MIIVIELLPSYQHWRNAKSLKSAQGVNEILLRLHKAYITFDTQRHISYRMVNCNNPATLNTFIYNKEPIIFFQIEGS